jgi:hypothetical protein
LIQEDLVEMRWIISVAIVITRAMMHVMGVIYRSNSLVPIEGQF